MKTPWGEYATFTGLLQLIDASRDYCKLGLWDEEQDDFGYQAGGEDWPDKVVWIHKGRIDEVRDLMNSRISVRGRIRYGVLIASSAPVRRYESRGW